MLATPLVIACGSKRSDDGPRVASDLAALDAALKHFEQVLAAKQFPMQELRPGLSREAAHALVAKLPFAFPEELHRLYAWHDGTVTKSLFRDARFLPLAEAIAEIATIEKSYGIANVMPFASYEGQWYVVPAKPWTQTERERIVPGRFELPVVEIFEGVTVHFHSLAHMIRTQTAWLERDARTHDQELAVWREINPGLF